MSAPYVTVNEAAEQMKMTPQGVREAIRSGRLKAVKLSERKTLVPQLSIDAYQARLNGGGPAPRLPRKAAPLEVRIQDFSDRIGTAPDAWLVAWRSNATSDDSAESMQVAIAALALTLEQRLARQPRNESETGQKAREVSHEHALMAATRIDHLW